MLIGPTIITLHNIRNSKFGSFCNKENKPEDVLWALYWCLVIILNLGMLFLSYNAIVDYNMYKELL